MPHRSSTRLAQLKRVAGHHTSCGYDPRAVARPFRIFINALTLPVCLAVLHLWIRGYRSPEAVYYAMQPTAPAQRFVYAELTPGRLAWGARSLPVSGVRGFHRATSGWEFAVVAELSPGSISGPISSGSWEHSVPLWIVALLAGALPGYRLMRCVGRLRVTPGHCWNCAHDLRATPEYCPECGVPVTRPTA